MFKNRLKFIFRLKHESKKKIYASESKEYEVLEKSGLFDREFYIREYEDVALSKIDPLLHYIRYGYLEGRSPGPLFDETYYISQCLNNGLSISELEKPLLLHYVKKGKALGLKPLREWDESPWWWHWNGTSAAVCHDTLERLSSAPPVAIIIPVFNAAEELESCLASLVASTRGAHRILLIDDASTDPRIQELLARYGKMPRFECYRNPQNLGFTRTVNRGMTLASGCDVVLLNSDTRVTQGWLGRLRYAAWQSDDIATATPLSNNAGAFSAPRPGYNSLPADVPEERIGRAVAQATLRTYPEVPTGNGYCMYIRRDCLDQTGLFDEQAFPRGYGEENDFCMRAARHGWRHVIDDSTYIFHARSASFGEQKKALLAAGRKIIDERYPQYGELVRKAFSGPAVEQVQGRVGELFRMPANQWKRVRPRVLYVISTRTGGTPQTNQDLMGALADEVEAFVLHCNCQKLVLQHFEAGIYTDVARHTLVEVIDALPHVSQEYDRTVAAWLMAWNIELIHVRHIAWHSLGLVEVAKLLNIPVVCSFHDFYTVCPSVKLLDDGMRYCSGTCTDGGGECAVELWPQEAFSQLKHGQIYDWRDKFRAFLSGCDAFVTTSEQVRSLILRTYPDLDSKPFRVIPHGRDFGRMQQLAVCPQEAERLRLVVPGNLSRAKGGGIIERLAQMADEYDLEIHIMGKVAMDLELPGSVVCHGEYTREVFNHVIESIRPHIGAVLSIWPETWCHTLTELWSAGVPVIGFDIGAVGERISRTGAGWCVSSITAEAVLQCLQGARTPDAWNRAVQAVIAWQDGEGAQQSCRTMGAAYWQLYERVLAPLDYPTV